MDYSFLEELRTLCTEEQPGNNAFWKRIMEIGPEISLIGSSEAEAHQGKSAITDYRATIVSGGTLLVLHDLSLISSTTPVSSKEALSYSSDIISM